MLKGFELFHVEKIDTIICVFNYYDYIFLFTFLSFYFDRILLILLSFNLTFSILPFQSYIFRSCLFYLINSLVIRYHRSSTIQMRDSGFVSFFNRGGEEEFGT